MTIIEALCQVLRESGPGTHILACAPSNSAADLIAQRLLPALSPRELFRCNALFRDRNSLPKDLGPYSACGGNQFTLPSLDTLKSYSVIVSTCNNASFAFNIGIPRGHFAYIFIDEAGQGTEPEILTAGIKTMTTKETRVVLSGDPKQLGPVIRSSVARQLGLGKSYLERLMEQPLYANAMTGRGRS